MTAQMSEPGVDLGALASEKDPVAFLIGQHMMIRDLFTEVIGPSCVRRCGCYCDHIVGRPGSSRGVRKGGRG